MFKVFINKIIKERNNLIDKLTIELLNKVGFEIRDDFTEFNYYVLSQEMKESGYLLELKKINDEKERLELSRHDKFICGYELETKIENNAVKIITLPMIV